MYNGYISDAKIKATLANHGNVVNFLSNEKLKCSLGTTVTTPKMGRDCKPNRSVCSSSTDVTWFAIIYAKSFRCDMANAFDSSDGFTYYANAVPTKVGRMNIGTNRSTNTITFRTRWGVGSNEVKVSTYTAE